MCPEQGRSCREVLGKLSLSPGSWTPDRLLPPSIPGWLAVSPQVSRAWSRAQALVEEGAVKPYLVLPSPWMGTSLQGDQVQGHNLSGLPSLLVHEALATLWWESVISPLSHPIAWSAFLDWPIHFSKTSSSTALCAEHFSLQEIE